MPNDREKKPKKMADIAAEILERRRVTGQHPAKLLTTDDLQSLHDEGYTRAQAVEWVREQLPPYSAERAVSDLDSYGTWAGD